MPEPLVIFWERVFFQEYVETEVKGTYAKLLKNLTEMAIDEQHRVMVRENSFSQAECWK